MPMVEKTRQPLTLAKDSYFTDKNGIIQDKCSFPTCTGQFCSMCVSELNTKINVATI